METSPRHARRARSASDLLHELNDRARRPLGVHLQIADRCNHACVHCYQIQGLKGELTREQLERVLDDLATAGILFLNVSGGEATLRPDLLEILAYARSRGFAIRLYTNAFALSDDVADGIARVGVLEVHVSVYSDRAEEHDAVTRVPGSLERTLEGVRRLRARGVRVVLKTPALRAALGATTRVRALAEALGCGFVTSTDMTSAEDGSLAPLAAGLDGQQLVAAGLATAWRPSPDDAALRARKLANASCGVCTSSVAVLPNGDVLPCTDTIVPLGNVAHASLGDVLRGNPDAEMFRDLRWEHVHGCRDCDLLLACRRCHATAVHQGDDYLGPYAMACDRARARYAAGVGRPLEIAGPAEGCEPDRDPKIGPYRITSEGVIQPIPDRTSAEDEARVRAHPWIRPHRSGGATLGGASGPEALVAASRLVRRAERNVER